MSRRFSTAMSIIRLVVFTVIAVALVKFAFFPAGDDSANEPLDPSFEIPPMTVFAETATISNTLELKGSIEPVPAAEVKSTAEGEITTIFVENGSRVEAGQQLFELRREVPGQEQEVTDEEGNVSMVAAPPTYKYNRVAATAAGTVQMSVLKGQTLAIGDVVASIAPGTFTATASMTPEQLYRVAELPDKATVTIKDGPAPFECTGLKLNTGAATAAPAGKQESTAPAGDSGGVRLSCAIPGDQKVFAGLGITLTVVGGEADDVLSLPVTAVEGRVGEGFVYVVDEDPTAPTKQAVQLGLTDGERIEIKEGLTAEQEVLEFTPIMREEALMCDPMTGEGCL